MKPIPHPVVLADFLASELLRMQAETQLRPAADPPPPPTGDLSRAAMVRLLHDLQVHEVELNLQNEELRHSQAELGAARAHYFEFYDLAPVGYVTVSAAGMILEVNLTLATLLGVARAKLLNTPLARYLVKAAADRFYLQCQELFETLKAQSYELQWVRGDGTKFWGHLAATVAHEAGRPVCRVIVTDITALKQVQATLEAEVVKRHTLFDQSAEGIVILDPQTARFVDFNKAAHEQLGYTREEFAKLTLFDLERAETTAETRERMGEVLRKGHVSFETRQATRQGDIRYVQVTAQIVEVAGDSVYQCFWRDITERKRAEQALRDALAEKTTLLKEVHHRVKNNLQIVSSLLSLQANQVQNQEVLDLLSVTRNRVRAMALLHESLYQSKNLAQIDLPNYVRSLCDQLLRATGHGGGRIALESQVENDKIALGLDQAVPCGLVINELVTNALKHAFPGDRRGRIQVKLESPAPQTVRLTVADDGIGLPATLEPDQAASLGLQLVTMLTKQLHGTVTFERGLGTTVQILFPIPAKTERRNE